MSDDLATINRAMDEHHNIRGHIKLVGDKVADLEALFTLETERLEWTVGSTEKMAEKQRELQQKLSFLDEGLKNHFAFEEKALSPLLGEMLMRALIIEHRGIKSQVEEAKNIVSNTKLEGLSQEELLSKKSEVKQAIDSILQLVEEHAAKEEAILKMAKMALEDKG